MSRKIVLGIGTGRCGTTSLAKLLDAQPGCRVSHEEWPLLRWDEPDVSEVISARVDRWLAERSEPIVGDVASFYLPYVEALLEQRDDVSVVAMERPRDEVIASFCTWLDRTQPLPTDHWTESPGPGRHHDPFWSTIFPKYGEANREAGIGRYWDEYREAVARLVARWPDRVRVWDVGALSDERQASEILDFVGVPGDAQVVSADSRVNQSSGVESRALPEVPEDSPQRCVVLCCYRDFVSPECEAGLRELERLGYAVRRIGVEGPLDQVRGRAATTALRDGFAETLWVDGRASFDVSAVALLRSHGLPIVGAALPRVGRRSLAVQVSSGTDELVLGKGGGLLAVDGVDFGLCHVRREAYELVQVRQPLPLCLDWQSESYVPWFEPMTVRERDGRRSLMGDHAFCRRLLESGLRVYVDTSVRVLVAGLGLFGWEESGQDPMRYDTYRYRLS